MSDENMQDETQEDTKIEEGPQLVEEKPEENPLDKIAYFVIVPQNTKILDDALALITNEALPREAAKEAVLNAINSVLVPVTKEQVENEKEKQKDSE